MSEAEVIPPDSATLARTINAARAAAAAGRASEADQLLARLAQLAPEHPAVLTELGLRMMSRGEAARAQDLFERATRADPKHPALWTNLASCLHALGEKEAEQHAIEQALRLEPRHLPALLQKAALLESAGETRRAARIYRGALATVPAGVTPPAQLAAALQQAQTVVRADDAALMQAVDTRLAGLRDRVGPAPARLKESLELFTGRRARYAPQPTFLYYPGLPSIEFFEREQFPWLATLEAATDAIRSELTAVLAEDATGVQPYVDYRQGLPLDQWRELNRSRRWGAYFLWKEGVAQAGHLARCPRLAAVLKALPLCEIADHGPTAFFSILEAHTHIPPHTGVTNARVTVHLPLTVPPRCAFRVGGETREWREGVAWVFDDTIEHEAWNGSDVPRAILIFDVWNPYLSAAERAHLREAIEAIGSYYGEAARESH